MAAQYDIITAKTIPGLINKVNLILNLDQGWMISGNVCPIAKVGFAQTLVKYFDANESEDEDESKATYSKGLPDLLQSGEIKATDLVA